MRIIYVTMKDLLQTVRDWKAAVFLLAMPVVFTLFFGIIFKIEAEDPRLSIGVINLDHDGFLSSQLLSLMDSSETVRAEIPKDLSIEELKEAVLDGDYAGGVLFPESFSNLTVAGDILPLTIIIDPASPNGIAIQNNIQNLVFRLMGAVESARIDVEIISAAGGYSSPAERLAALEEGVLLALAAWESPPLSVETQVAVGFSEDNEPNHEPPSSFSQSSPGMIVQFSIFGLMTGAGVLVNERKSKSLLRMLTTPTRKVEIIAGHMLGTFAVIFLQVIILIILGQFVFNVDYLQTPYGTLLMAVVLAFFVTCLGLLIGVLSKTEDQVSMYAVIFMMLLCSLGGAWFPLEITGETFNKIGHLLPTAWAMEGFQNIIVRQLGFQSVIKPAAIIGAYGLALFAAAVARFKFE